MEIARRKALKPLRQLRGSLQAADARLTEEQVHAWRTRARRVEAVLFALDLNRKKKSRKLLKLIRPLHKAAGRVRDMDVLLGCVQTLQQSEASQGTLLLAEQLTLLRLLHVQELQAALARQRQKTRKALRRGTRLLKAEFERTDWQLYEPCAELTRELAAWTRLHAGNLHEFRLEVKSLLYTLTLATERDEPLIAALAKTKDAIGAWHDWDELANLAATILDPASDRSLLDSIEASASLKLVAALAQAKSLRRSLAR